MRDPGFWCEKCQTKYERRCKCGKSAQTMSDKPDYSSYKCPYEHIEKECGHELHGPQGYEDTFGVWCACGFRGPVFCLDTEDLKLEKV